MVFLFSKKEQDFFSVEQHFFCKIEKRGMKKLEVMV
jgi:hypothetical protein